MMKSAESFLIAEQSPVAIIPGIGRRTAALLHGAGIQTVGSFTRLPDLLLEYAFGPSLPVIRRRAEELLAQSSKQQFTSLIKRVARQLMR
jgi:nucleotidyltransferase/DNA polymerase involved in DNA repair